MVWTYVPVGSVKWRQWPSNVKCHLISLRLILKAIFYWFPTVYRKYKSINSSVILLPHLYTASLHTAPGNKENGSKKWRDGWMTDGIGSAPPGHTDIHWHTGDQEAWSGHYQELWHSPSLQTTEGMKDLGSPLYSNATTKQPQPLNASFNVFQYFTFLFNVPGLGS